MPNQATLDQLYKAASPLVIRTEWVNEQSEPLSVAETAVLKNESDFRGRSYLEIGVGKGNLYREVANRGGDVMGVEPGLWADNLPNIVGSISDLPHTATFDVVVANDVLEHLANPVAMLSELRAHARPNARLYARFPNSQSLRARIRKGTWNMIRPLGHLHYFSRESAKEMFARGGWALTSAMPSEVLTTRLLPIVLNLLRQGDQWLVQATATPGESPVTGR